MKNKWLYRIPRVLSIIFAVFISLFALDVFGEGYSFWETVWALVMHLVPTYMVVIAALVAWKWEGIGGCIFIALGLSYVVMAWNRASLGAYFLISAPLVLIGGMFILHWIVHTKAKAKL